MHQNGFASYFDEVMRIVRCYEVDKSQVAMGRNKVGLAFFHLLEQGSSFLQSSGIEKNRPFIGQDGFRRRIESLGAFDLGQRLRETAAGCEKSRIPVMGHGI